MNQAHLAMECAVRALKEGAGPDCCGETGSPQTAVAYDMQTLTNPLLARRGLINVDFNEISGSVGRAPGIRP